MLNVKERLPSGPDFKFLFHFTQVIRVKWGWMSVQKHFVVLRVPAFGEALRGL
ncbi:hypothetical protein PMI41_02094 [Phyllobacterium sp. YR531]|nr:hypothetical protein PMI41_02094 [Phyllobacterium sp. YR531]